MRKRWKAFQTFDGGNMFCPSCGFESAQKTKYCKRCGGGLGLPGVDDAPKLERPNLATMFFAVVALGVAGMFMAFVILNKLVKMGVRGDELIVPFVMTLIFTGSLAGLLIWQLARLITAYQKTQQN